MPGLPHVLVGLLVVASAVTAIAAADPPRPGSEGNGLTENESATLWSRDADNYIGDAAYRERFGESRSAIEALANGTDITFRRPPATAATWTRNDFTDLTPGNASTSRHPEHATLQDGTYVQDAHATIFAVQPSTRAHRAANDTPLYVAPNGSLRGFIDYRVRIPDDRTWNNTSVSWRLTTHDVDTVRLQRGNTTLATLNETQTPAFEYHLQRGRQTTLTLEADIRVELRRVEQTTIGNQTNTSVTRHTETVTVSDTMPVERYDLTASVYAAEYPNGDTGVAVFQNRPWQGYSLTRDGQASVRGVWRFYTARDDRWDTLTASTATRDSTVESDALPVYVHAYPSRIGPRAEPERGGPELLEVWGRERDSVGASLGEHITVDVVDSSYTTSYGVAVRHDDVARDVLRVSGIVRGVNATIVEPQSGSTRQLRQSNLTITTLERTADAITLRIELSDNRTGEPIALAEPERIASLTGSQRNGYITIADQRVETNASGVAVVTLDTPGSYTARYHPGSWLEQDPAYTSDTATIRWHPLGTVAGWYHLLVAALWVSIPFVATYYAGTRLLAMFRHPRTEATRYR